MRRRRAPLGSLATDTGGAALGARLSLATIRAIAAAVGFPDPDLAAAVAMAESGGWTAIRGDNGDSIGLWQVNLPAHPQYTAADLADPFTNARAAFAISSGGRDFSRGWWTTWTTGSYRRYLPARSSAAPWILAALAAAAGAALAAMPRGRRARLRASYI